MAFTGKICFRILGLGLGLGSVALVLALHVSGLGLGLDTSGLVNISAVTRPSVQTASDVFSKRICSLDTSASSALGVL